MTRRRAWQWAGCTLLAVAVYLNVWTAYALHGLTDYGRYVQHPPGEPVTSMGARFSLVSLQQTTRLTNTITGEVVPPPVHAVWLVARIDVARESVDPGLVCSFEVLGPDRRVWAPDSGFVSRELESTCRAADLETGGTLSLEVVFQIPESYVGDLAGIVVNDPASRWARPVLVPPA